MKTGEMSLGMGHNGVKIMSIILNFKSDAQTSIVFESNLTAEVEVWGVTEVYGVFIAYLIKSLTVD